MIRKHKSWWCPTWEMSVATFRCKSNRNENRERSTFPITFMFTRQTPPSHRSKDNPCWRTHCAHEPSPWDIPPSAALWALSAQPSARGFGCPLACHPWTVRRCSIFLCSRCCDPCSGRPPLLLICPHGCFRHGKSRNDSRCRKKTRSRCQRSMSATV